MNNLSGDLTPKARSERLKRLRNIANLSRKSMCENSNINLNTLIGWEVARHGGLSNVGAKKAIERISREGVICSLEWLMQGSGLSPKLVDEPNLVQPPANQSEEDKIAAELLLFKNSYLNTTHSEVTDDSMHPIFSPGDTVAGIKLEHLGSIINTICIVQLPNKKILLRLIKPGSSSHLFNLVCTNYSTTAADPIIHNTKLISAAPVIWHRKKLSLR